MISRCTHRCTTIPSRSRSPPAMQELQDLIVQVLLLQHLLLARSGHLSESLSWAASGQRPLSRCKRRRSTRHSLNRPQHFGRRRGRHHRCHSDKLQQSSHCHRRRSISRRPSLIIARCHHLPLLCSLCRTSISSACLRVEEPQGCHPSSALLSQPLLQQRRRIVELGLEAENVMTRPCCQW